MSAKDVLPKFKITNDTPFVVAPCPHLEHPEQPQLSIVAKGSWHIAADGQLTALDPQRHFFGDTYADADPYQELLYPNEMELWKPSAEVIIIGSCYTPQQQALTACTCGFRVGSIRKQVAVIGDRYWMPGFGQDLPSEPKPFTRMPLSWSRSIGNPQNAQNPIGTGSRGTILPNFENPDNLLRHPDQHIPPVGLSPINRMWESRSELVPANTNGLNDAGYITLDPQTDFHFCNAAPADQRMHGYFRGDEQCEFTNLHPENPNLQTQLPGINIRCLVRTETELEREEREVPMHLDTVVVNLDEGWIECLWRGITPISNDIMPEMRHILIRHESVDGEVAEVEQLQQRMAEADVELHPIELKAKQDVEKNYQEVVEKLTKIGVPAAMIPAMPDILAMPQAPNPETFPFDPEVIAQQQAEKAARHEEHAAKIAEIMGEAKVDPAKALEQIKDPNDLTGKEDFQEMLAKMAPEEGAAPTSLQDLAAQAADNLPPEAFQKDGFDQLADTINKTVEQCEAMGVEVPAELAQMQADLAPGGQFAWIKEEAAEIKAKTDAGSTAPLDATDPEQMQASLNEGFALNSMPLVGAALAGCALTGQSLAQASITNSDLGACNLQAMAMHDSDFSGSTFEKSDLSGADMHQSVFNNCIFKEANLSGANLEGAMLLGAVFENCNLEGAIMKDVSANKVRFIKCQAPGLIITDAELSESVYIGSDFMGADFTKSALFTCNMQHCSFVGANFSNVALLEAHLDHCQFTKAILNQTSLSADSQVIGCSFEAAEGEGSSWMWARFIQCYWTGAKLKQANFIFAHLAQANFSGADLENANFRGAQCQQAIFQQANLLRCTFHQANLSEADIMGANAYEADFGGANLDQLQSDQAILTRTILG